MNDKWYYSEGDRQVGPVLLEELRKRFQSGQLSKNDLVWNEAMPEWVEAGTIPEIVADTKTRAKEKMGQLVNTLQRDSDADTHFLDPVLKFVRGIISDEALVRLNKFIFQSGYISLFAAMVLAIVAGVMVGMKIDKLSPIAVGIGASIALAVLQFTAKKMRRVLESLITSTPTTVSETFPDCYAMFCIVLGIGALLWFTWVSYQTESLGVLVLGIGEFLLFETLGILALHPKILNTTFCNTNSAGIEAIGIISFLLKMLIRLVMTSFGIGVTFGTVALVVAVPMFLMGGEYLERAVALGSMGASMVFTCAVAPFITYLLFIFYYLTIAFIEAVLVVPPKLDALRGLVRSTDGH